MSILDIKAPRPEWTLPDMYNDSWASPLPPSSAPPRRVLAPDEVIPPSGVPSGTVREWQAVAQRFVADVWDVESFCSDRRWLHQQVASALYKELEATGKLILVPQPQAGPFAPWLPSQTYRSLTEIMGYVLRAVDAEGRTGLDAEHKVRGVVRYQPAPPNQLSDWIRPSIVWLCEEAGYREPVLRERVWAGFCWLWPEETPGDVLRSMPLFGHVAYDHADGKFLVDADASRQERLFLNRWQDHLSKRRPPRPQVKVTRPGRPMLYKTRQAFIDELIVGITELYRNGSRVEDVSPYHLEAPMGRAQETIETNLGRWKVNLPKMASLTWEQWQRNR